jgi:ornithine cyclodeaminase/alanine dehydrogenase-like protein (mu-crystallin family)
MPVNIEKTEGIFLFMFMPPRTNDNETILLESVGFTLEDLVATSLMYRRAREKGIEFEFTLI